MVLVKNMNFFPSFPIRKNKVENVFVDILDNKRALLDYKNVDLKNSKKCISPKGVSLWFWSKLILGKIGQENGFDGVLDGKKTFLCYKSVILKKVEKKSIFAKVG